ncbi:unnamed protein product [Prorocentrum cordatum]|uniref:Uncharacterized protein n=1 Tax=Prorocentrum cordatum TaxID=2364126 RepID=A0ABN9Y4T1_9DINO|nr:unnamed protein product [Polarella glacialis]
MTCVAASLPETKPFSAWASGHQPRGADGGESQPWRRSQPLPACEPPAPPPVPAQSEPGAARWGELARAAAADSASSAEFSEVLRARALPKGLDLARLQGALLSCVEGLYRDRVRPDVGEVQRRLRGCGWQAREAGAAAAVAARDSSLYHVVPPQETANPRRSCCATCPAGSLAGRTWTPPARWRRSWARRFTTWARA